MFRAVHRTQHLPAAVKVLSAALVREDRHARQFQEELLALASLDHPAIVTLLDAGAVTEEEAAATQGRLVPGTPWLALEYASEGTLGERAPTDWPQIRDLTLTVLDALAHAHARGIVHRDLKPANLLWCGPRDARPGLKLSDFGVAVRVGSIEPGELAAGTPQYMAPEQLGGDIQDVGPWTDLYSLGCLVWRLTTGALPFESLKRIALIRAHLAKPLPPYAPQTEVPAGLEDWLRALLAKRPEDRPQRAADAAAALVLIDPRGEGAHSRFWASVLEDDVELLPAEEGLLEDATGRLHRGIGPPAAIPDWRAPLAPRPSELLGAGLGLFGLREPPVVGRSVEQDLLWDELRAVAESGRPRAVVVRGPSGIGRTRLGRWLCARADEVGAARVIWSDGSVGGLTATVASLLRVAGRSPAERREWLTQTLGDAELAAGADAFLAGELPEARRGSIGARLLLGGRADRPTILCLDDAHRSEPDLDLAARVLELDEPCLLVLLVDDEACSETADEHLRALGGLEVLLPPLSTAARRDLLAALVRLEEPLAAEVEERSEGNPAFLVEVLGDWVRCGWLEPGPRGFSLRPDVSAAAFPASRVNAAARRLREVLAGMPLAAERDLTLAAALGPTVDEALWHTACDDPGGSRAGWALDGLARRARLVDRLVRARMLGPRDAGFVLQSSFREAVVARARESGRWSAACATAARVAAGAGRVDHARIGHLLLEAGLPGDALPALLSAVGEALRVSARRALSIWVDAERAARLAGLAPDHREVTRLWLARARVDLALGDPAAAHENLPPAPADPALWLEVSLLELDVLLAAGALAMARSRAAALRARLADPETLGRVLLAESEALAPTDPSASLACLEEAREAWSRAGVGGARLASLSWRQARRARAAGDHARARLLLERTLDEAGPRGDPQLRVQAGAALAEVWSRLGDPAQGLQVARRAIAAGEGTGHGADDARVAAGICRLLVGDAAPAVAELDEALRGARRAGRRDLERRAHAALAAAHVATRTWPLVHDHLRELEREPAAVGADPVLTDLVRDLGRACRLARYAQLHVRAQALLAG